MTVNELYKWVANPSALTKASLPELKQLVDEYPYFQAARMLYLKNLSVVEDIRFQKELKRMSVYLPDRKRLYQLIESRQFEDPEDLKVRKFEDLKIRKETETETEASAAGATEGTAPVISDYVSWLESNVEDIVSYESEDKRLKHQDLIDSFMESDGKLQISKGGSEDKKMENDKEDEKISLNETYEKNTLDDSYFTETLARVYFSQKRYDKALEIIRVLSLKYPKKNTYFADQIRYLEEIINIKK
jgi:hypothetical protein